MSKEQRYQKKIKEVVEILKGCKPEKIIVFGSAIKGKIHKDSDIDICLIKKGDPLEIKRSLWNLFRKANYDWEIETDIHVYPPSVYYDWFRRKDPFIEEIEKGKVAYERCKEFDQKFSDLDFAVDILTGYYTDTRYPDIWDYSRFNDPKSAKEALKLAEKVVNFVSLRLKKK